MSENGQLTCIYCECNLTVSNAVRQLVSGIWTDYSIHRSSRQCQTPQVYVCMYSIFRSWF